jgi:hypothetical protein
MAEIALRPFWRRSVIWWFVANGVALVSWIAVALTHWPWPNYGYCDIPIYSWSLFADAGPGLFWMISVVALLVVAFRAFSRRDVAMLVAVAITTVGWTALARHNFVPNAQIGDGCAASTTAAPPSNTSLERTREG